MISDERLAWLEWLEADPGRLRYIPLHEWEMILARLRKAEEIVAKLPRTADGVPVTGGEMIFCPSGHGNSERGGRIYCLQEKCYIEGCQSDDGGGTHYPTEKCYSTREAATPATGGGM